ncbi:histidine kinase [Nitratireductor sp. ZSWI3]|uniref:histidine kinase n=1 Tax=Nitratireductor sp. ZSWI3 TaxID=2966359 RepID=UPI0021501AC4|nr:histidine kinase [Nitratireductor sp. ZSWI3]MCR4268922.1 histidine kinase [Nitratireductor sp. ZSWI3]
MAEHQGHRADSGKSSGEDPAGPLDLAHLARQTLGDKALEREVLGMFVMHIREIPARMAEADGQGRRELAHALTGSACSMGAFRLAEQACILQNDPLNDAALMSLFGMVDEAIDFIVYLYPDAAKDAKAD